MTSFLNKLLISVLILGCCSAAIAKLPKESRVPGGIAIIDLQIPYTENTAAPQVFYQGHRTLVLVNPKNKQKWLTIVGIPLTAKSGPHTIEIVTNNNKISKTFNVKQKNYPQEHLTVNNKRKVNPLPEDLLKIEQQYLEIIKTYASWSPREITDTQLKLPVAGRKSSPFGLRRIMNNIAKDPHSGLDVAAQIGTPVKCPLPGKVINVGNFFYNGNTVFVDHGQGFITNYCHLNSIAVAKGQELQEGEIIGQVGKTGRVTGPHLHWSVSLNNVRVDPQLFLNE